MGVSINCPGRIKLKFCTHIVSNLASIGRKAHLKFREISRVHSQRLPNIFRALDIIYRAHRAVIFASSAFLSSLAV